MLLYHLEIIHAIYYFLNRYAMQSINFVIDMLYLGII